MCVVRFVSGGGLQWWWVLMMVEVGVAMVVVKGWVFVIGHLWVCVCGGGGCRVGDGGWVLLFVVVL